MGERVAAALGDARLRDTDGKERAARELWATRPALLLWVRHFG